MDEHLGLQNLVQTRLVHKIEVRHNGVLICRTMEKNRKISLAKNRTNQRKIYIEIFNLDLRPHLVSPLSSGRGGHRATPLTQSKSPYLGPCWSWGGTR